eukprot:4942678-Alexandrium_andersonii.AAC.1
MRGAAAFAQVEAQDGACVMASTDESNAFSFVEVPSEWWVYQAGPAVRADALDPAWVAGRWSGARLLRPCYKRLAMGFTHS